MLYIFVLFCSPLTQCSSEPVRYCEINESRGGKKVSAAARTRSSVVGSTNSVGSALRHYGNGDSAYQFGCRVLSAIAAGTASCNRGDDSRASWSHGHYDFTGTTLGHFRPRTKADPPTNITGQNSIRAPGFVSLRRSNAGMERTHWLLCLRYVTNDITGKFCNRNF